MRSVRFGTVFFRRVTQKARISSHQWRGVMTVGVTAVVGLSSVWTHTVSAQSNQPQDPSNPQIKSASLEERLNHKSRILARIFKVSMDESVLSRVKLSLIDDWSLISHYSGTSYPLDRKMQRVKKDDDYLEDVSLSLCSSSLSSSKDRTRRNTQSHMRYAMKHACCAYPHWFLTGMDMIPFSLIASIAAETIGDLSVKSIVTEAVFPNISGDGNDWLLDRTQQLDELSAVIETDQGKCVDGLPAYYICKDDKERAIVVCVRGTTSWEDIITDINFRSKEISDPASGQRGFVHKGMWRSALHIAKEARMVVKQALSDYPDYRLVITGHSLGAGTAALLAFIWGRSHNNHNHIRDEVISQKNNLKICDDPQKRIECFAFASPCVLSQNLADTCHDYVTTVIVGTDFITRVGLASVRKMLDRLDLIDQFAQDYPISMKAARHILGLLSSSSNNDINDNNDDIDDLDGHLHRYFQFDRFFKPVIDVDFRDKRKNPPLFPLGTLWWYVPNVVMDASDEHEIRQSLIKGKHHWKKPLFITDRLMNDMSEWVKNSMPGLDQLTKMVTLQNDDDNDDDGMEYILCDATEYRDTFGELVFDSTDSILTHCPSAYSQAMGLYYLND